MTTSNEHERVKKCIGDFLAIYFEEKGIEIVPRGQATIRLTDAGAEPDESWCIGEEKQFPDLVLEIALTTGGINKLGIYQRFKVPEVWLWKRNKLEIFCLNKAGSYEAAKKSRLLPSLDISLLERCLTIGSWLEGRRAFREGLRKTR